MSKYIQDMNIFVYCRSRFVHIDFLDYYLVFEYAKRHEYFIRISYRERKTNSVGVNSPNLVNF